MKKVDTRSLAELSVKKTPITEKASKIREEVTLDYVMDAINDYPDEPVNMEAAFKKLGDFDELYYDDKWVVENEQLVRELLKYKPIR